MRTYNEPLFTGTRMNTTLHSAATETAKIFGFAIQAVYTGTPTGTLFLEGSADPSGDFASPTNATNVPTNWSTIANSAQAVTAAGNFLWNVADVEYNWVRLSYTDTSGGTSTALLTARINAKGI